MNELVPSFVEERKKGSMDWSDWKMEPPAIELADGDTGHEQSPSFAFDSNGTGSRVDAPCLLGRHRVTHGAQLSGHAWPASSAPVPGRPDWTFRSVDLLAPAAALLFNSTPALFAPSLLCFDLRKQHAIRVGKSDSAHYGMSRGFLLG